MAELIPRRVLFGNPERISPHLSPDGTRLAWIAPHEEVLNVWIAPIGGDGAPTRDRPARDGAVSRSTRPLVNDPFAEIKRTVHQALLETLGPKLYDSRLSQPELEQRVRQTLQEVR